MPIPLIGPQLVEEISQLLWDFGFRWHGELQTRWIQGSAGLGSVAPLSDKEPPEDDLTKAAMDFLAENNPALLDLIGSDSEQSKEQLLTKLESNFRDLQDLIAVLKKEV